MGTISIYNVRNALEEEGWELISDTYKNLKTELEMKCPHGHTQFQTFEKWRKYKLCDVCLAGDPYKIKQNKVPPKADNVTRILALDAATSVTGYALYDSKTLVSYGTFKTANTFDPALRINQVKHWLKSALNEWQPDFVGIENIQLQSYGPNGAQTQVKTFQTLANLQGVLVDTVYEAGIERSLVRPSEWRSYCGINDGDTHRDAKKKAAQAKVRIWYDLNCSEDEADAICIGKYFCNKIKTKTSWGEDI